MPENCGCASSKSTVRIGQTQVCLTQGDITELDVEAIVNAANNKLVMGGGVAGAIKRKGGKIIEDEAIKKGPIAIGEAVYTSAGSLPCKYVIHAATMGMDFKTDEQKIRASCAASLTQAEELKISSLAFPALGCGTGGFPLLASAKIMAQEVLKHVRSTPSYLREIVFCLYDPEALSTFERGVVSYIRYFTEKMSNRPFTTVDAIIEIDGGIVLIKRSNPPFGYALPGGFVDSGESLEEAVIREAKEETNLELLNLKQFHTYSDPRRDPRFHTIGTVFIAQGKGDPEAGDDAAEIKIIKPEEIKDITLAFDHKNILTDYLKHTKKADLII